MIQSSNRNGAEVLWVVVHTAEGALNVSSLRRYFDSGVAASSHAGADDEQLSEGWVPYDRSAWTLRKGNSRSDNLELCGFAKWTRETWLSEHKGMLDNAARWIRQRCLARGIPIVKLTPDQVRDGVPGVIGHVDYTNATGDGTHWDPGPGFPWDYVISKARPTPTPAPIPEEEDVIRFVKGDSEVPIPNTNNVYGDVVFKVEFEHDFGPTAVRTRVTSPNDPGFRAFQLTGGKVHQLPQAVVDAIPDKPVGLDGRITALTEAVDRLAESRETT